MEAVSSVLTCIALFLITAKMVVPWSISESVPLSLISNLSRTPRDPRFQVEGGVTSGSRKWTNECCSEVCGFGEVSSYYSSLPYNDCSDAVGDTYV